jgi:hypothetical protein
VRRCARSHVAACARNSKLRSCTSHLAGWHNVDASARARACPQQPAGEPQSRATPHHRRIDIIRVRVQFGTFLTQQGIAAIQPIPPCSPLLFGRPIVLGTPQPWAVTAISASFANVSWPTQLVYTNTTAWCAETQEDRDRVVALALVAARDGPYDFRAQAPVRSAGGGGGGGPSAEVIAIIVVAVAASGAHVPVRRICGCVPSGHALLLMLLRLVTAPAARRMNAYVCTLQWL